MELSISDFDVTNPFRLKRKGYYAIMFKATYCGHCTQMYPIWNKLRSRALFMDFYTFTADLDPKKMEYLGVINNSLEKRDSGDDQIDGFPMFLFYNDDEILKIEGSGKTVNMFLETCKQLVK